MTKNFQSNFLWHSEMLTKLLDCISYYFHCLMKSIDIFSLIIFIRHQSHLSQSMHAMLNNRFNFPLRWAQSDFPLLEEARILGREVLSHNKQGRERKRGRERACPLRTLRPPWVIRVFRLTLHSQ